MTTISWPVTRSESRSLVKYLTLFFFSKALIPIGKFYDDNVTVVFSVNPSFRVRLEPSQEKLCQVVLNLPKV